MKIMETDRSVLEGLSFEELRNIRDDLLKDIRAIEEHTAVDQLDIDLDLVSSDVTYLKDLLRLSAVVHCMAEKQAVLSHNEIVQE